MFLNIKAIIEECDKPIFIDFFNGFEYSGINSLGERHDFVESDIQRLLYGTHIKDANDDEIYDEDFVSMKSINSKFNGVFQVKRKPNGEWILKRNDIELSLYQVADRCVIVGSLSIDGGLEHVRDSTK